MAIKPFNAGNDVAQKTERWTQDQIDRVERAKEQQQRREQEANQQRDTNPQNRQAGNNQ
jgi:hypothetical protein